MKKGQRWNIGRVIIIYLLVTSILVILPYVLPTLRDVMVFQDHGQWSPLLNFLYGLVSFIWVSTHLLIFLVNFIRSVDGNDKTIYISITLWSLINLILLFFRLIPAHFSNG